MTVYTDLTRVRGQYKVVLADCPWTYAGDTDKPQAAGKHYNMMSFKDLAAIPVWRLFDGHGVLMCWATGPLLDQAIDLIRAWGLHYRGVAYVWVKTTRAGEVIEGQGVRPSFVKSLNEFVLIGSTQPRGRTLPLMTESQGQNVFAPRPDGVHSRKPDEVRWRIEELFGDVPRIELFARVQHPGWDQFGLEADGAMPSTDARSPKLQARLAEQESYREAMALLDQL